MFKHCNISEYFALIGGETLVYEHITVCVRFVECTGGS